LALLFASDAKFSVSIGSSATKIADVNIDVRKKVRPDIVADACHLPLRAEISDCVIFTDVVEHLPRGKEQEAFDEISRILQSGARAVISTPSATPLFKILDPSWYISGHRHYSVSSLVEIIEKSGLTCRVRFESGFVAAMLGVAWYSFVSYPAKRILKASLPYSPKILRREEEREYRVIGRGRFTIFVIAQKH
jgi:SAM-dependent methyltransferase